MVERAILQSWFFLVTDIWYRAGHFVTNATSTDLSAVAQNRSRECVCYARQADPDASIEDLFFGGAQADRDGQRCCKLQRRNTRIEHQAEGDHVSRWPIMKSITVVEAP